MRRLRERWCAFFFRRSTPFDLGVCRVLFFGLLLLHYGRHRMSPWAEVPDAFWWPTPFFRWLHVPVLPGAALAALDALWWFALGLSALGLFTRVATAGALVLGVYLLGLPQNFGKVHHSETVVVFTLLVFAVARCGDGLSLDALRARRPRPPSGEYTWPVRAVWIVLLLVYFAAGISKLRHAGLAWVTSDNMAHLLLLHHYSGHAPPVDLGLTLARSTAAPRALAGLALLLEVGAPLALLGPRLRVLFAGGLCLMQAGIWLLLGVPFHGYLVCFLFFVPWHALARRFRPAAAPA